MSPATETFDTLLVASTACGIALTDKISWSLMSKLGSHVLGFPVWTHELGTNGYGLVIEARLRRLFPTLPSEDLARADWKAAADAALALFGPTLDVPRGNETRTEGAVESLARITGRPEDIIVVSPEALN